MLVTVVIIALVGLYIYTKRIRRPILHSLSQPENQESEVQYGKHHFKIYNSGELAPMIAHCDKQDKKDKFRQELANANYLHIWNDRYQRCENCGMYKPEFQMAYNSQALIKYPVCTKSIDYELVMHNWDRLLDSV